MVDANFTMAYVFSAYIDDRPTADTEIWRSNGLTHVLRIFTWFLPQYSPFNSTRRWKCVLWNDQFDIVNVIEVAACTNTQNAHQEQEPARCMLLCPYNPENCTADSRPCRSLLAVSIVTLPSFREPINLLPVVDLPARRERLSSFGSGATLISKSSEFKNGSKPMVTFAVCPKPIYGKSIGVDDLIQFIEVNRVFGAELFFFYVDDSINPNVHHCIKEYERKGIVESIPWKLPPDLDSRLLYKGQLLQGTECLYRLMYRSQYLISMDIDEFIVPTRTDDWKSMLALIESESNFGNRTASFSFRNRFFLPRAPIFEPTELALPTNWSTRFRVLTWIIGETRLFPYPRRSKILAPPERVLKWQVHAIVSGDAVPSSRLNVHVEEKDAVLHHYRKIWNSAEPVANFTRMWYFASKVIHRLKSGLELTGFA